MKTRYSCLIIYSITFFFLQSLTAQMMIPKKSYMHFTGQIGKKYELTMELVKINDSIYADCQCLPLTKDAKENPMASMKNGEILVISGKMRSDGSCSLGLPFSKTAPMLTGQLSKDQKLTGIWSDENGKLPFELKEKYVDGSVQLNVSYLKGSQALAKKPGSPKGAIEMALLTPGESTDPVLSDTLKKIILEKFTKKPVTGSNPDLNLSNLKQTFFEKYISSNEELYKNKVGGASLNWESLEFMHVLYNDKHFLTFYIISYAFTGGAHGLETHEFYVIDLKSGKVLTPDDIFIAGADKELGSLITQKFKDINSLKPGQQLTEAGFFTDEVKPVDNIYLTGEGIGFFYNHYEIAPYASSPNNCFIPFSELKNLLRPDGALRNLLR
jgi:hypothetical protein